MWSQTSPVWNPLLIKSVLSICLKSLMIHLRRGNLFCIKKRKHTVGLPLRKHRWGEWAFLMWEHHSQLHWLTCPKPIEHHPGPLPLPQERHKDTAKLIAKFVSFYSIIFMTACSSALLVTAIKKRNFFFSLVDLPWIWEPLEWQFEICSIQWMWNPVGFIGNVLKLVSGSN